MELRWEGIAVAFKEEELVMNGLKGIGRQVAGKGRVAVTELIR